MSLSLMEGYVTGLKVHASHFGYHPDHPKQVICNGLEGQASFEVVDAHTEQVIHRGSLVAVDDDFGPLLVGDFSELTRPGEYFVRVGSERSFGTFAIKDHLWDELQKFIAVYFFGIRRIGEDNIVGNLGDFHGVRWDDAMLPNGEGWRYIGTAFDDGDDRRVYPSVSLVVAQYCALKRTAPFWDNGDWIYSQVRWGLDGALSFLDKDGILRRALYAFPDHDTDGQFNSGDEKILGDAFDQQVTCNEYSLVNREVVYASLLLGPAEAVLMFRDRDPAFFDRVAKLCEIGYERIGKLLTAFGESGFTYEGAGNSPYMGKYSAASWVWLSALMHQITGREEYKTNAIMHARMFLATQQSQPLGDDHVALSGWYRRSIDHCSNPWGDKPEQEVMITPWIYQALFRLLELYPDHEEAPAWRASIRAYAHDYLYQSSKLNVFGYTTMKVGSDGLKRRRGTLSYQYFTKVGRMFHQIGNAAYLLQAGQLLGDRTLIDAGWTQMQWYAGVNPLGIGGIYGLSTNMPSGQYHADSFGRCVLGGTKNGMTGDANDQPEVRFWEYYTYANLNVLWFATVAGSRRFSRELELWPRETAEAPHEPTDPQHSLAAFPVRFKGGFTYRFTAMQTQPLPLRWLVNGVEGGSDGHGRITPDGVYHAPYVTAIKSVTIQVQRRDDHGIADQTNATIMPAPRRVEGVRCRRVPTGIQISWTPVADNCSGYTIWRRLPVTATEAGTIFERVGAVPPTVTEYTCQLHCPPGTEFLVRAYHRSEAMIYGYGPTSDIVTVTAT